MVTPAISWRAVTSPPASSVEVSTPRTTSPVYDFGAELRNRSRRVAEPTPTTSTPVASGSRVPACPMRRSPKVRRHTATTS
jgi:hypothetical protein